MPDIKAENIHPDKSTLLAEIEDYLVELNENELNSICGGIVEIELLQSSAFIPHTPTFVSIPLPLPRIGFSLSI